MQRILCGVDFEGRARHAVLAAVWLSEKLGASLELVHAFPPRPILWGREKDMPEWVGGTDEAGTALRTRLQAALADAPRELGLRTRAADLELHVTSGHPAHVILERARAIQADLILLGPHAKRGWTDLGNTARGVLAHATAGVWIQPEQPRVVRRLLVPLDLSPGSLSALSVARDLARAFDGRVTALQAFLPPVLGAATPVTEGFDLGYVTQHLMRTERERFEAEVAAFEWRGVQHEAQFETGDPAELVLARQDDHDLVVMGTHGRTGLSAALLGSVAQSVVRASRIPVLALRAPRGTYLI